MPTSTPDKTPQSLKSKSDLLQPNGRSEALSTIAAEFNGPRAEQTWTIVEGTNEPETAKLELEKAIKKAQFGVIITNSQINPVIETNPDEVVVSWKANGVDIFCPANELKIPLNFNFDVCHVRQTIIGEGKTKVTAITVGDDTVYIV